MLPLEIDTDGLKRIADEFAASEKELSFAYSRALRRTAQTMKTRARKGLRTELKLRTAAELRKRLQGFRFKRGKGLGEVKMWFGLNDMRVSAFKGRASRTGAGASFAGHDFPGAFIARNRKGRPTVMRRATAKAYPIREERMPIEDKAQRYIEDEVFNEMEEVFFKHFRAEVRAKTLYGAGKHTKAWKGVS
ncbi:phage tail protein [Leisingera sp. ANG-Vp]|uniref:phage tail protein n=1 Tax=Leisingera sp. ANG-Vp TaxID=1577896 RepID=UPI00057FBB24|nr:phage tail protein [Leisingera sp. ANG-Vp]KIC14057.1 tail protein [Leisingera sp. ANG-Vp]